jgi:hypothetical protein
MTNIQEPFSLTERMIPRYSPQPPKHGVLRSGFGVAKWKPVVEGKVMTVHEIISSYHFTCELQFLLYKLLTELLVLRNVISWSNRGLCKALPILFNLQQNTFCRACSFKFLSRRCGQDKTRFIVCQRYLKTSQEQPFSPCLWTDQLPCLYDLNDLMLIALFIAVPTCKCP